MRIIPERLRGRAFALLRTLMQSGTPIGGALGGVLLPLIGIPAMIALSACIVGAPGLIGVQVRELRAADNRRGNLSPGGAATGGDIGRGGGANAVTDDADPCTTIAISRSRPIGGRTSRRSSANAARAAGAGA